MTRLQQVGLKSNLYEPHSNNI